MLYFDYAQHFLFQNTDIQVQKIFSKIYFVKLKWQESFKNYRNSFD